MSDPIVSVRCIRHVYPDSTEVSLCGMEFDIKTGEIVAVLAANGAGKTTLLQHITGMLKPVEGSVRVFGMDPYKDFEQIRPRLGGVFQNPAEQIIGPTVQDDIAFGMGHLKLSPLELHKRVLNILKQLGIEHLADKVPHYLSGGEVKKVALAGALAPHPDLLILDEPFSELDTWAVAELVQLLRRVNQELGCSMIFTSHQLEPVALLADRVYVLHQGRVLAEGTPQNVFQQADILAQGRLKAPYLFQLVSLLRQAGLDIQADWDVAKVAEQIVAAKGLLNN